MQLPEIAICETVNVLSSVKGTSRMWKMLFTKKRSYFIIVQIYMENVKYYPDAKFYIYIIMLNFTVIKKL